MTERPTLRELVVESLEEAFTDGCREAEGFWSVERYDAEKEADELIAAMGFTRGTTQWLRDMSGMEYWTERHSLADQLDSLLPPEAP